MGEDIHPDMPTAKTEVAQEEEDISSELHTVAPPITHSVKGCRRGAAQNATYLTGEITEKQRHTHG